MTFHVIVDCLIVTNGSFFAFIVRVFCVSMYYDFDAKLHVQQLLLTGGNCLQCRQLGRKCCFCVLFAVQAM